MDFTIKTYRNLLEALIAQGYAFQTFAGFLDKPEQQCIILRHDVDKLPGNSLEFARIQNQAGVKGSYYFRIVPQSFDENIIREIASLGHEIGYHYEDMHLASSNYKDQSSKFKGQSSKSKDEQITEYALGLFLEHLEKIRELYPVKTISMHGSPMSKYDNRDLWRISPVPLSQLPVHYTDYGIIGEPYFDIDFSRVFYLTDTGRRWDGEKVSIRDKVGQLAWKNSKFQIPNSKQTQNSKFKIQNLQFHCTQDIINAANAGQLPQQIMFTFHPQRWTDKPMPWVKELVLQNLKNVVKRWVVRG